MNDEQTDVEYYEPDVDMFNEQLYDLYVTVCEREGTTPSIHDYVIWIGENYD